MSSSDPTGRMRVLICGGGIAGPALAFWLARAGHRVTVVERFPALRATGAQIDLRGHGIEVVERMGLLEQVRDHRVAEPGVAFVDERGRPWATILANTSGRGRQSLTSEYEIMRGDLVRILHAATADRVEYRFGRTVESVEDDPGAGSGLAHLDDGTTEAFDLLVAADGQGSRLRAGVVGPGAGAGAGAGEGPVDPYRRLGLHMAYWFVPRTAADPDLRHTYTAGGGRMVMRRSHTPTDTQVYLTLRETSEEASAVHRRPVEEQQRFWADRFADVGWQVPRFLDAMAASPSFYSQEALQVQVPRWSRGRVALLGDAAWCPSPFSGMGTTTSLVGAYTLAHHLGAGARDLGTALQEWEDRLRPYVVSAQARANPRLLRLGTPTTRTGARVLRATAAAACALRVPQLVGRLAGEESEDWQLPPAGPAEGRAADEDEHAASR